ncbi:MAG: divalent-cation tolerance protein CutA [Pseudoxanthomonas suwonensis]|nr:divalent-cation tolerance protein CutA [Pseudoxanthomonas suwonensis]
MAIPTDTPYLCLCTCPNTDTDAANSIAETLVTEGRAACVNILPGVRSVYRWEGRIQRDDEWLLLIKTTADQLQQLKLRVNELHPYSTPELISVQIDDGLPAYLQWMADATTADASAR